MEGKIHMKKIMVFILLILTLISMSGCKNVKKNETDYEFETITKYTMSSKGYSEIDKKLAFEIGSAILESNFKEVEKDKMRYHIKYLKYENMYIILWVQKKPKESAYEYGIAIDKDDGEILRMWKS